MKSFIKRYGERLFNTVIAAGAVIIIAAPLALSIKYSLWWLAAYLVLVPLLLMMKD